MLLIAKGKFTEDVGHLSVCFSYRWEVLHPHPLQLFGLHLKTLGFLCPPDSKEETLDFLLHPGMDLI